MVLNDNSNLQFDLKRFGGSFDLTDWAMRSAGGDPYSARKLAFLERTRNERAGIAVVAKSERIRDSMAPMKADLHKVWNHKGWSARRRRAVLFQLWDECAETGPRETVVAGARARATIIAFIRRQLPRGSASAYTAGELHSLNAGRTSSPAFAPYAADPP